MKPPRRRRRSRRPRRRRRPLPPAEAARNGKGGDMPRIDVLTLFPRMLDGFLAESILGKGLARELLSVCVHDLRKWTTDKHRTADDRPFGGGAGMVLKPEPVFAAIEELQTQGCMRIYLTPDGVPLTPAIADRLSRERHLILLSGHYEGVDQRI